MNDKRIQYALLAVLILVAVVFFAKRKQRTAKLKEGQATEKVVAAGGSKKGGKGPDVVPVTGPSTEAAIQRDRNLHAAGFVKAPLKIDDKGAHLSFHVQIKKTCDWGDLDLIRGELAANKGAKILLSIESVNPNDSDFTPVTKVISFDQLASGFDHTFTFPPAKQTRSLGLFLCSDLGSNSCGGKNIEDFNVAYKQYAASQSYPLGEKPPVYRPPLRTYFFQHVLLSPDSAQVQFATKMADEAYDKAEAVLVGDLGEGSGAKAIVSRVKELNQKITSLPVQASDNDLTLVLSMEDKPAVCPESIPPPGQEPPTPPEGMEGVQLPGEKYYRLQPKQPK
ncbi:MAG: hypothetical protein FJ146_11525 [Deltaproteobacteria bacterium]|nr:hypothetical protein [Deltaproteobacteria bacterium]